MVCKRRILKFYITYHYLDKKKTHYIKVKNNIILNYKNENYKFWNNERWGSCFYIMDY